MAQARDGQIPSPCTGVCRLDDDEVCLGCRRSVSEIAAWSRMTDPERRAVIERLSLEIGEGRDVTSVSSRTQRA